MCTECGVTLSFMTPLSLLGIYPSRLNTSVNFKVSHVSRCCSHANSLQLRPNLWIALLCPRLNLTLLRLTRRSVEHRAYSAAG